MPTDFEEIEAVSIIDVLRRAEIEVIILPGGWGGIDILATYCE